MVFKRKLRASEAERHFSYVDSKSRDIFPPAGTEFEVVVEHNRYDVKLYKHGRIWVAYFWDKLASWKEGDTIIMNKNRDGSFSIEVEG